MTMEWQAAWQALIHHPLFGVGITLGAYQLAIAAYEKTRWVFLQPVLVSMLAVIGILLADHGGAGGAVVCQFAAHLSAVLADADHLAGGRCSRHGAGDYPGLGLRRRAHHADEHGA